MKVGIIWKIKADKTIVKKIIHSISSSTNSASAKFQIVVGCFSVKDNATRLVNTLRGRNIDAALNGVNKNGLHVVSAGSTNNMEEARQLLMDCKCGEYEIVYDLLVTRWMLLGRADDRNRFLTEAASLPISARQRMSTWAHIRNGSKDSMNAVALEVNNPKSQSDLCDLLFLASFHFNVGKIDETVLELLEVQEKLRALQTAGLNKAESWLLETAKKQLTSKVDEILAMVNRQRSKQIN